MRTIPIVILFCLTTGAALAGQINVPNNSPDAIRDAVASANPDGGDVIQLKDGVSHWPPSGGDAGTGTTLNITTANTRPVTIQGGAGTEIIYNGTGTSITWNVADDPSPASGAAVLSRLTGVRFTAGTAPWHIDILGHNERNSLFRFDHCRAELTTENAMSGWIGLIDHVDFVRKVGGPMLRPAHSLWSGGAHGNKSWQEPLNWFSDQWIYIEDCNIYSDGTNGSIDSGTGFYDATSAARIIVRHDKFYHGLLLTHGNDTGNSIPDASRGVVAMGVFANHFYNMASSTIGDLRSGVQIAYGNRRHQTQSANQGPSWGQLKNYRQYNWAFAFGGADGNPANKGGQYDNNDQTNTTTAKAQNATQLHAVSASTGNTVIIATGLSGSTSPGWANNVWAPTGPNPNPSPTPATVRTATYYIINKTKEAASSNGNQAVNTGDYYWSGVIDSNTGNQITFYSSDFISKSPGNLGVKFNTNDEVEIRKINSLMDGCGMHGDAGAIAMIGNPAANPPTVTKGYNSGESTQIVLPCYFWDNYVWNDSTPGIGAKINAVNSSLNSIREGTHFINLAGSSTNAEAGHWTGSVPPDQTIDAQGNIHGFKEYPYPHVLQGAGSTPSINTTSATFTVGGSNSFLVTTAGFRGVPTITLTSWTGPTPNNVNFGTPNCAAATFCGTATGNNPGDSFTANLDATFTDGNGTQHTTQVFTLNMALANTAPSWPGGSFTAAPTSGTEPLTVALSANPIDDAGVVKVEFYRDGNLINTDTTSPYAYSDPALAQGTYSYTGKAYDGASPQLSTSSSPVSVTVSPAGPSPTPPAIMQIGPQ